jgi:hypothetical protein
MTNNTWLPIEQLPENVYVNLRMGFEIDIISSVIETTFRFIGE